MPDWNKPLPTGDEILDALMIKWRPHAVAGNRVLTPAELHKMAHAAIRKLLSGRQVPQSLIQAWIDSTLHLGLEINQYAEHSNAKGGFVLTDAGLRAMSVDPGTMTQ